MSTVNTGWLKGKNGDKFAPKTLLSQIMTSDGITLESKIESDLAVLDSHKADVDHNHNSVYETKTDATAKLNEAKSYTDTKTSGLASTSSVNTSISNHNTSTSAHNDIRNLITGLTNRLNALADSDDTTLDQISEIVAYIKANKSLIDSITTSKVNVSDIVNNLTTNVSNKPLSAAQGVVIKGLIDTLQSVVDGKADKVHTHAISDVNELQITLDTMNENLKKNTWYGTCPTAAATTEKVVTTASGDFRLEIGSIVYVLFTYASCVNATLNVDGKGAKAIKIVGNNNVSTYHWGLNEVVGFAYDGTYFRMLDGQVATTTYYGVTKLSSSTSSTSTTAAATPSAVKAAYDLANSKQDPATTLSGYGITDAYTKADHEWVQIYDSGATTEQINSFANINISGYKKIMMAIKCVNDTTNASTTRYGSAIFKATNGTTYQFPVFNSMFFGSETTTASIGFFEFIDGWIVCPQVVRSIKYADFLTSTEGGTCTNMNNMGSGLMKCTNAISTVTISNLDQNADFYFGVGSRVIVWGCNA